jgi:hypothetical protein
MPNLRVRRVVTEFHPLKSSEEGQSIGQMIDAKIDELIANSTDINGPQGFDVMDVSLFFDPDSNDWPDYMRARIESGVELKPFKKARPVKDY